MNQQDEVRFAKEFFDDCLSTLVKKAHDYAQDDDCFSNFSKIADTIEIPIEKVFLMFIVVKIARIVELSKKKESLTGESMMDSLSDITNYACLLNIYLNQDSDGKETHE